MAGHSHAKNVAMRKGAVDAKRSKIFTKMSRLIIQAAREGGGDINGNAKLAFAVAKAKSYSVPKDTIEKAIKKGTGESAEADLEKELVYEGYGPAGVAILCDIVTDNPRRTAGEIRTIFDRAGGNLGATGCVGYLFARKGQIYIEAKDREEDALMELLLEAGADDLKRDGEYFEILCEPTDFTNVCEALQKAEIEIDEADIVARAETRVDLDIETARKVAKLLDILDDHNDVQNVFSNANLPDEVFEE